MREVFFGCTKPSPESTRDRSIELHLQRECKRILGNWGGDISDEKRRDKKNKPMQSPLMKVDANKIRNEKSQNTLNQVI